MDEIRIENLEVYAYHGVYEKEKEKGQTFFVNAVLYTDFASAGMKDDLELSTDYGSVCTFISKWMTEHRFDLLESIAERLSQAILFRFPLIQSLDLEIRKPEAPIPLPFESVSVKVHRGWHQVYLSVGSNMGDRRQHIQNALNALCSKKRIKDVVMSSLIETKPYGGVEQDDFLNGAISLKTLLSPADLLKFLHKIEASENRERLIHWGPRTLDLDILFYDKLVYEDDDLIIPHVDLENRSFVLEPLSELAPNFRHPILNRTVTQMKDALYVVK